MCNYFYDKEPEDFTGEYPWFAWRITERGDVSYTCIAKTECELLEIISKRGDSVSVTRVYEN